MIRLSNFLDAGRIFAAAWASPGSRLKPYYIRCRTRRRDAARELLSPPNRIGDRWRRVPAWDLSYTPSNLYELAPIRAYRIAPQLAHRIDALAGARRAPLPWNPDCLKFLLEPADADAERDAPVAQPIERRDNLCEDHRVVLGDEADAGAETNFLGRARHRGQRDEWIGIAASVGAGQYAVALVGILRGVHLSHQYDMLGNSIEWRSWSRSALEA